MTWPGLTIVTDGAAQSGSSISNCFICHSDEQKLKVTERDDANVDMGFAFCPEHDSVEISKKLQEVIAQRTGCKLPPEKIIKMNPGPQHDQPTSSAIPTISISPRDPLSAGRLHRAESSTSTEGGRSEKPRMDRSFCRPKRS